MLSKLTSIENIFQTPAIVRMWQPEPLYLPCSLSCPIKMTNEELKVINPLGQSKQKRKQKQVRDPSLSLEYEQVVIHFVKQKNLKSEPVKGKTNQKL